jgi:pimeloyl-ACP methyl ester carboxylesterase
VAYVRAGEGGYPLLLVHGWPETKRIWWRNIGPLAEAGFEVIAPDLRGFGESTVAPPYSMDQYADDVARLLDALGIDRAVMGGVSMGGYITFALWRRHRDRLRGLILIDTRAGADSEEARAKRQEMIEAVRVRGSAAAAEAMIDAMIGKTTRERQPGLTDFMRAMMAAAPADGVIGALGALASRPDSGPTLATIDVPTLIVVGQEDALTPPRESDAMCAAIVGSRLEILPGAGHVSNVEQPAAFNRVVSGFLQSFAEVL